MSQSYMSVRASIWNLWVFIWHENYLAKFIIGVRVIVGLFSSIYAEKKSH